MRRFTCFALAVLFVLPACQQVGDAVLNTYDLASEAVEPYTTLPDAINPKPLSYRIQDEGACPEIHIVHALGASPTFSDWRIMSEANLVSRADVSIVESKCSYGPKSVTVDVTLRFKGRLGLQAKKNGDTAFSYPYFIAIESPGDKIMAKQVFSVSMDYSGDTAVRDESLRQIIPLDDLDDGADYEILTGFQLTDRQFAYNRATIERLQEKKATRTIMGMNNPLPKTTKITGMSLINLNATPQTGTGPLILGPRPVEAPKKP